jgi:2-oxo-4-hydroxy-4-carboxy-5-ureidoimidazoline decarboxylase
MPYTLTDLNQMNPDAFVAALGAVFEDTPEIARQAWNLRPFSSLSDLHQKMVEVVMAMSPEQKLKLIQSHPDLGSRAKMAEASVKEQAGVGMDRLTAEEYDRFHSLNGAYKTKFGFPFIIAVKNHTKTSILEEFQRRLDNPIATEMEQAITEITQIAHFRLLDLIQHPS